MKDNFEKQVKGLTKVLFSFLLLFLVLFGGLFYFVNQPNTRVAEPELEDVPVLPDDTVENGIHIATGFVADDGMQLTIQNCTSCHSAQLVTQNRMSRQGWEATIRWMQETQNLWDLGANEEPILTYLSKNYAPVSKGRRQNLNETDWYPLK